MKASNKLAVLLSLGALLPLAAMATTPGQAYLETCRKGPGIPTPTVVVAPVLGTEYVGASAEIEFTVDATGKTSGFKVKSSTDSALADAVVAAVKQWQFTPAKRGNVAVSTTVVLPVHVVDDVGSSYAAN